MNKLVIHQIISCQSCSLGFYDSHSIDRYNCFRATFLLDPDMNVVSIEKCDIPVGLNIGEQLRQVQVFNIHIYSSFLNFYNINASVYLSTFSIIYLCIYLYCHLFIDQYKNQINIPRPKNRKKSYYVLLYSLLKTVYNTMR